MKITTEMLKGLIAPALLILALGCKPKPVDVSQPSPSAPAPANRNFFIGNWEGKDKSGATYTLKFTANLQWESHIEEGGSARPHYKGTYEPDGTRVRMKVTEEGDLRTFAWRPEKGNMPASLTGNLTGGTLKVANVLTEAELRRR